MSDEPKILVIGTPQGGEKVGFGSQPEVSDGHENVGFRGKAEVDFGRLDVCS